MSRFLILFGLASALALPTATKADFVPVFVGTSAAGSGETVSSYDLVFTTALNNGTPNQRLEASDFLTIYDIGGLVGDSATVTGPFSVAVQNAGDNAFQTAPLDNPALPNVTVRYTGSTPLVVDSSFHLALTYRSPLSGTGTDSFTSETTRNSDPNAGTSLSTIGVTTVPITGDVAVPEPASMVLLGLGTIFGLAARRRARA